MYRSKSVTFSRQGGMNVKKVYPVLIALIVVTASLAGCTKGYESEKTAGELVIMLEAGRYPLVKGKNAMSITVTDTAGKTVIDAAVQARYYMPAVPGMPPIEFNTAAVQKGKGYEFSANIPVQGAWKIDVLVTQPGKEIVTATFTINAR